MRRSSQMRLLLGVVFAGSLVAAPANAWVLAAITVASAVVNIVGASTAAKASRATSKARAEEFEAVWNMLNSVSTQIGALGSQLGNIQRSVDDLPFQLLITPRMESAIDNAEVVADLSISIADENAYSDQEVGRLTMQRLNVLLIEVLQDIEFFQRRVEEENLAAVAHLAVLQEALSLGQHTIALWALELSGDSISRTAAEAMYQAGIDKDCSENINELISQNPAFEGSITCQAPGKNNEKIAEPSSILAYRQLIIKLKDLEETWTILMTRLEPEVSSIYESSGGYREGSKYFPKPYFLENLSKVIEIIPAYGPPGSGNIIIDLPVRRVEGACFLWSPYIRLNQLSDDGLSNWVLPLGLRMVAGTADMKRILIISGKANVSLKESPQDIFPNITADFRYEWDGVRRSELPDPTTMINDLHLRNIDAACPSGYSHDYVEITEGSVGLSAIGIFELQKWSEDLTPRFDAIASTIDPEWSHNLRFPINVNKLYSLEPNSVEDNISTVSTILELTAYYTAYMAKVNTLKQIALLESIVGQPTLDIGEVPR